MDTRKLWNRRAISFWGEVLPYFRYVASSGLAAFLIILFIVTAHYYAKLLDNLPDDFSANWIAAACVLPVLAVSPIRTFFNQADLIYLLPAEAKMKFYIKQSLAVSFIVQAIFVAMIWFMVWPLYRVSEGAGTHVFWLILFILLIMKWMTLYGHWREQQFQERFQRQLYILLRWGWTAVILYILFTFSLFKAAIFAALVLLTYTLSLRLPSSYAIHWEYLIGIEKLQRARFYLFLSWFVDVPEHQSRVHSRPFFSRLTKWIPFQQQNAYRYLYLKTWIRSDLFGIVARLIIIGMAVIYMLQQDILKAGLYIFFVYLIGIQLSALEHHHRYVFWIHVYPLPQESRIDAVHYAIFRIHYAAMMLLYVPVIITFTSKIYAVGILLLATGITYVYHLKLRKNLRRKVND